MLCCCFAVQTIKIFESPCNVANLIPSWTSDHSKQSIFLQIQTSMQINRTVTNIAPNLLFTGISIPYSTAQVQHILTARTQLATKPMLPNPSPRDRYIYLFVFKKAECPTGLHLFVTVPKQTLCVFMVFFLRAKRPIVLKPVFRREHSLPFSSRVALNVRH